MDKILELSKDLKGMQKLKEDIGNGNVNSDTALFGLSMKAIFVGFFFSMIGFAYFRLGKKDQDMKKMILGVILMIYPYFITNIIYLTIIGLVLSFLPVILKSYFSKDV